MSTSAPTIRFSNATNALIKAWGSAINAALSTVGMVQTTDTGQINWTTTVVTATGASQTFGYEIWRFNDTLQATKPIFFKVVYGTNGSGSTYAAPIGISVGTGTDGAGNLTGLVSNIRTDSTGDQVPLIPNNPTYGQVCYFFSDGSSLAIALNPTTNTNPGQGNVFFWMIERTRNTDNTPNGDGIVYANTFADRVDGFYYQRHNFISFVTNSVVGTNFYWPLAYTGNGYAGGIDGSTLTVYSFLVGMPKPEAPSSTVLGYQNGNLAYYQTISLLVNGALHTYLVLPGVVGSMPGLSTENNNGSNNWCGLLMRYE